jgi:hypothetical protein
MRTRTTLLTVALCLVGAALCVAQNPNMGTWKLNEAKSKVAPGFPKNNTIVYEAAGDDVKVTTEGVGSDGKPSHTDWTGKFDGKPYPVTGDPTADTRTYTQVNDRTLTFVNQNGDKPTISGRIVVSADGKSRTVTVSRTGASGKKITSSSVFDKE